MKRIELAERWAYRVALLLLLVAAARFGWALTQVEAQRTTATILQPVAPRAGSAYPGLPPLANLPNSGVALPTPEAISSAIAAAVGTAPMAVASDKPASPPREIISSFLSVQAGPSRSELRVNGGLVGKTPFLGQISCERGQTVKLDLLPPSGLPTHYEIPCLPGEMRLRDEP